MSKKTSQPKPKPSAFSRLHQRQAQKLDVTKRQSSTLMALSDKDHKAIAALIKCWLEQS
jgi:hypothetical protein